MDTNFNILQLESSYMKDEEMSNFYNEAVSVNEITLITNKRVEKLLNKFKTGSGSNADANQIIGVIKSETNENKKQIIINSIMLAISTIILKSSKGKISNSTYIVPIITAILCYLSAHTLEKYKKRFENNLVKLEEKLKAATDDESKKAIQESIDTCKKCISELEKEIENKKKESVKENYTEELF